MKKAYFTAGHTIVRGKGTGVHSPFGDEAVEARKLVTDVAKRLYDCHNVMVITDDDNWTLRQVINWLSLKLSKADIAIDFHFNAFNGKAHGTEVLVPATPSDTERDLAVDICQCISKTLGIRSRGMKRENESQHKRLGVLHSKEDATNLLVEVCFIDNEDDVRKYRHHYWTLVSNLASTIAPYIK